MSSSSDDDETRVALVLSLCPTATTRDVIAALRQTNGDVDAAAQQLNTANAAPPPLQGRPQRGEPRASPPKYFAGGSENSGLVVEAPGREEVQNSVESLFQRAQTEGATLPEGGTRPFSGLGHRLGYADQRSYAMQPVVREERAVTLSFYRNGFQLDDGPLQSMDTPEARAFLAILNRGHVPPELKNRYPNANISIKLIDHAEEDYVPPPYAAFSGGGNRLGASSAPPTGHMAVWPEFSLEEGEETCTVLFQTFEGRRIVQRVNPMRHTVAHLYRIASTIIPQLKLGHFDLIVRDVPPRKLSNFNMSIDEAQCRNAVLLVK